MIVFIAIALAGLLGLTVREVVKNINTDKLPARPDARDKEDGFYKIMNSNIHKLLQKLEQGGKPTAADYEEIEGVCAYLDARFDCSDFRMQTLIRILFRHSELLEDKIAERIKGSLLNSKFFMDQPGQDSLCLWSENHLLLFATAEYLTGQLYENEIFSNDGLTGKEHKAIAVKRLNIWLEQRFKYGFIEWYSNTYYEEDIGPLANLIDFCDDPLIVTRARMILDLLLHDLATQSHRGSFTSTSGRQYEEGKKSGNDSALRNVTRKIWGYDTADKEAGLDQHFIFMSDYEVPHVIKKIGEDHNAGVIKASTGLNLKELVSEYPNEQSLGRVMMQWAMEAFSNPEVITDTLKYIHKNKMLSNEFMNDFKIINLSVLKHTGLLPIASRLLKPVTNGTPIQRANTYTFKTEDYMLATAQNYHPGEFGDQQHIWSATVSPDLCIFTTHPASPFADDGALSASPSYWVGNGRNPHSVQHRNINLSLYLIEGGKGFMERDLLEETHCYFPTDLFDDAEIGDTIAFGRKGNALIAVRGTGEYKQRGDEIIQKGRKTAWVTELGSLADETYDAFKKRIRSNSLRFEEPNSILYYTSGNHEHALAFKGEYMIDGVKQNLEYQRFESPYCFAERKSPVIEIEFEGEALILDFERGVREVRNN